MGSRSNINICILTETYYPVVGGGEIQARALARAMVACGNNVCIITRRISRQLRKIENDGGANIYRIPPIGEEHIRKWGLLITCIAPLLKLRRQYDLIFVSGFRVIGISAILISRLLGKACILKADSPGEMSGEFFAPGVQKLGLNPIFFIFKPLISIRNAFLRLADGFVAISTDIRGELLRHGVKPANIQTLPNSADTVRYCPVSSTKKSELRRKLDLPADNKIIIFSGRLVSYKGLPLLLRIWKEIQQIHHNATLLLVGSGGLDIHNCEEELKHFVQQNGMQTSVRFTGSVQNVNHYLQASDIFVFPTENEAFGISLIEAMACGLPAVATSVGGIKDVLTHQKTGLVIQKGDARQLYKALDLLITDSSLAANLGRAARRIIQDRYADSVVSRRYMSLFEQYVR